MPPAHHHLMFPVKLFGPVITHAVSRAAQLPRPCHVVTGFPYTHAANSGAMPLRDNITPVRETVCGCSCAAHSPSELFVSPLLFLLGIGIGWYLCCVLSVALETRRTGDGRGYLSPWWAWVSITPKSLLPIPVRVRLHNFPSVSLCQPFGGSRHAGAESPWARHTETRRASHMTAMCEFDAPCPLMV